MGNSASKEKSPVKRDEVRSLVRNSESSEMNQNVTYGPRQIQEESSDLSSEKESESDNFQSTASEDDDGDDKIVEKKVNIITGSLDVQEPGDSQEVVLQERLRAKDLELGLGSLDVQEPGDSQEVVLQERLRAKDLELGLGSLDVQEPGDSQEVVLQERLRAKDLELGLGSLDVQEPGDSQEVVLQERLRAKDLELGLIKSENLTLRQEIQRIHADSQKLIDLTIQNAHSSRLYIEERFNDELASSILSHQLETKESLKRICPAVSIDSTLNYKEWLEEYENQTGYFRQPKILVLGPPPEQKKHFVDKESQCEKFHQEAKNPCCIQRLIHDGSQPNDKGFPPIKKSKSLGSLQKKEEADKSLKRKLDPLEKQEEDLRLNVSNNPHPHGSCTICKQLERKSKLNPIRILLNYTEHKYNKKLTFIVDTNILILHMSTIEAILSTPINGETPDVMVPFIVTKEIEKISKDELNKNKLRAFMARESMKKLEKVMRKYTNIVEQTLQQMRASTVWKSKSKTSDDTILECCIQVQKSGYNTVMWSEDKNLRIKILGHRILALSTTDVCEILSTKMLNPLEGLLRQNKEMNFISQVIKKVPDDIIQHIRRDPKNAIDILTGMHDTDAQPLEQLSDEPTPTPSLEIDLNIATLFEPPESGEKSPWTVVDDGDDDIY